MPECRRRQRKKCDGKQHKCKGDTTPEGKNLAQIFIFLFMAGLLLSCVMAALWAPFAVPSPKQFQPPDGSPANGAVAESLLPFRRPLPKMKMQKGSKGRQPPLLKVSHISLPSQLTASQKVHLRRCASHQRRVNIFRHCGVLLCTPHSSTCLPQAGIRAPCTCLPQAGLELFTVPSILTTSYEVITVDYCRSYS